MGAQSKFTKIWWTLSRQDRYSLGLSLPTFVFALVNVFLIDPDSETLAWGIAAIVTILSFVSTVFSYYRMMESRKLERETRSQ